MRRSRDRYRRYRSFSTRSIASDDGRPNRGAESRRAASRRRLVGSFPWKPPRLAALAGPSRSICGGRKEEDQGTGETRETRETRGKKEKRRAGVDTGSHGGAARPRKTKREENSRDQAGRLYVTLFYGRLSLHVPTCGRVLLAQVFATTERRNGISFCVLWTVSRDEEIDEKSSEKSSNTGTPVTASRDSKHGDGLLVHRLEIFSSWLPRGRTLRERNRIASRR